MGSIFRSVRVCFVFIAIFSSGEARCPICETTIQGVGGGGSECPKCLHYFEIKDNRLREIDLNSVRSLPVFGIPLPHGMCKMPSVCCACGEPAKRTVPITMETPLEPGPISTKSARFSIDMPHCNRHTGGADIGSVFRQRAKKRPELHVFE